MIKPSQPNWAQYWSLDPAIVFLNHGSFGACPLPVLALQQHLRQRIERQPLQFFGRDLEQLLDQARIDLAAFVGADADDLAFVPNATTGINTILRSLTFEPGDELLTTNQEYNACRNALEFVAARSGAKIVVAEVPYPIESAQQAIELILQAVSSKTRLALLDHITSQTGLVFPIAEIIHALTAQGVDTLIDGAHAPGMVALDLTAIAPTYYTGNCHKWLCAPKGAAFLYVQRDKQAEIRPLTISHGANSPRCDRSQFRLEFDWTGTDDPTAYLCVPEAIRFMGSLLPGGWSELMAQNRAKAIAARKILCEILEVAPPCPDQMIGSLATVPLSDGSYIELQDALLEKFGIEVPIVPYPSAPNRLVRISAQIYNTLDQYDKLGQAIVELSAHH
ncbi:aminotransferase class V-fold PLP-dependent enzyme [Phormidesmis priestleyi ULC007]|uniref:Aminotransferase class V-fold PLP-dependent enzyme n=1 Tax=Phormidesmis priestleyi ULC007 TaxID=1920490 RepID=A0A2T1DH11_9CYAN|nr:aminotransferase class V-fold PLP-dependent enzyme [Phormidesmis priestleyi]PSB19768.1 aminotransferase class V-fold PLP-dependent enzyme [Phormidesmis priestleyi ULC007]PZO53652.1 MAG: aminotransferase class V-fold PLP-dependent enzyme [Phormidesmis priestleyi]